VQETFTISNTGERILEYEIAVPEVPWIAVNPLAGELEPAMEQEIVVEGIHSGLPNDEYEVNIVITSNDPENGEISLNVRLVIDIEDNVPRIFINADTVLLEINEPDQQAIDTLLISNNGYQPLVFTLDVPQDQTWFDAQPTEGTVEPDSTVEIVVFTTDLPLENGEYESAIGITSNDPENGEVSVEVRLIVDIQDVGDRSASSLPQEYHLSAPFPNPFNNRTSIRFDLPTGSFVDLNLIDINGKFVRNIVSRDYRAGSHNAIIDANRLASGVYFLKMNAASYSAMEKIVLIR